MSDDTAVSDAADTSDAAAVSDVIEIEIPARADYVSFVRLVAAAAAELAPSLEPTRIDDLRVAVSEATTNAIQAHNRSGCARPVRVSCRCSDGQVTVTVRDEGPGFDADALPEMPPPESAARLSRESGMGISIIRALADSVSIDSSPRGTALRLVFGHRGPAGPLLSKTP